jgi:hypothetical protein
MDQLNSASYVFNTHPDAQEAVRSLSRSGFDVKKLSLIGKGHNSEQTPIGLYTGGDQIPPAKGKRGLQPGPISLNNIRCVALDVVCHRQHNIWAALT